MPFPTNDYSTKPLRSHLRRTMTPAERFLWDRLRNKQIEGQRFLRQFGYGPYVLDFYCHQQRLAVELDGDQHAEVEQHNHDEKRRHFLNARGVRLLRFWNNEIFGNIDGVLETIHQEVSGIPSQPPLTKGRG